MAKRRCHSGPGCSCTSEGDCLRMKEQRRASPPLPPSPSPPRVWVREHHAGGYVDRPAAPRSAAEELDLERWSRTVASKPSAAGADDGTRVEAVPARGAVEGHGWSVSATRTIGKVPERKQLHEYHGGQLIEFQRDGDTWSPGWVDRVYGGIGGATWLAASGIDGLGNWYAATCDSHRVRPLRVSSVYDAVRDEPVLPDPEPEQNVRTTRDDCPTCKRPQRERGEVRTSIWRRGCAVRPGRIDAVWLDRNRIYAGELSDYDAETASEYGYEGGWCAESNEVAGYGPTREFAIAAWRAALAELQRREDER